MKDLHGENVKGANVMSTKKCEMYTSSNMTKDIKLSSSNSTSK